MSLLRYWHYESTNEIIAANSLSILEEKFSFCYTSVNPFLPHYLSSF